MSQITGFGTSGGGGGDGTVTYNYTSVTTTPYVVQTLDELIGVTTSALSITIKLPNAPAIGRVYIIKDGSGFAAVRNITVTTVGGTVIIDAATTFIMNSGFEASQFLFNGTKYLVF